jgi:hypothetical protein
LALRGGVERLVFCRRFELTPSSDPYAAASISLPAISTVHAVLDRHNLVTRGRDPRYHAEGTTLSRPTEPNDLWCASALSASSLAILSRTADTNAYT